MRQDILDFYQGTSAYTDLGLYADFARSLPDDLYALARLQRSQIIHPVAFYTPGIRTRTDTVWGDMTRIPETRLQYEDDIFPTAQAILHELLRRNPVYGEGRRAEDKVFVTCRGQALLLTATLKAKGIPARVRSGYAGYVKADDGYDDHWITEYYDAGAGCWKLADADIFGFAEVDVTDIPRERFLTGGQAWLSFRSGAVKAEQLRNAGGERGIQAAVMGLFDDFHALMGNEIIFLHLPRYLMEKGLVPEEEDCRELDGLARLLLEPDQNFDRLREIWEKERKYRILSGGLNG